MSLKTWVLKLAYCCRDLHQWEFMSIKQKNYGQNARNCAMFWVSNGSIRVNLVNENVSIMTHGWFWGICPWWSIDCRYQLDFISTDMVNVCVLILSLVAFQNLTFYSWH